MLLKCMHQFGYCRCFLANCHVNTDNVLSFLVQNRICSNRSLTSLTVSDDQLTLSTTNREHRVNCQNTGLQRSIHRFTINDSRCRFFYRTIIRSLNLAFSINRFTKRVYNTADISISNRNTSHPSCAGYTGSLFNLSIFSKKDTSNLIFAHILHHGFQTIIKYQDFSIHCMIYTIDVGNTITDTADNTNLLAGNIDVIHASFQNTDDCFLCYQRTITGNIQRLQFLLQSLLTSGSTPVILFVAGMEDKSTAKLFILFTGNVQHSLWILLS